MRDFSRPRTYILSAFLEGVDPRSNERRHADLVCDAAMEGYPFRECEGSYKGTRERSLVLVGSTAEGFVREQAQALGQESFLVIAENDRAAYLVDPSTGYHTHLGKFTAHGDTEPECDGWTFCDGTYYIVEPCVGVDLPGGF